MNREKFSEDTKRLCAEMLTQIVSDHDVSYVTACLHALDTIRALRTEYLAELARFDAQTRLAL